jgi:threonylcarbamoyladenosine tRNA methylthiotransferase MtaB
MKNSNENLNIDSPRVVIITLGCRSNQYESGQIAKKLHANGVLTANDFSEVSEINQVEYVVLNTCSITNMADKKSRQQISKIRKAAPKAKIIVLGCSSKHNDKQFEKEGVVLILGTADKIKSADFIINDLKTNNENFNNINNENESKKLITKVVGSKSARVIDGKTEMAYLKIQEGCNNYCTFCVVPYLRGASVSRDFDDVISEAKELAKTSHEIVLTAINISDFKQNGEYALTKLVKKLGEIFAEKNKKTNGIVGDNVAFSFGSLYPSDLTKEFLEEMHKAKIFKPFFHLSMQHGSDKVLKHMNRHYTAGEFIEKVALIREVFDDRKSEIKIGADIISGYPTETDLDAKNNLESIEQCGFNYLHVFDYSPKTGTPAAKLKQLPELIKKERRDILLNYASSLK